MGGSGGASVDRQFAQYNPNDPLTRLIAGDTSSKLFQISPLREDTTLKDETKSYLSGLETRKKEILSMLPRLDSFSFGSDLQQNEKIKNEFTKLFSSNKSFDEYRKFIEQGRGANAPDVYKPYSDLRTQFERRIRPELETIQAEFDKYAQIDEDTIQSNKRTEEARAEADRLRQETEALRSRQESIATRDLQQRRQRWLRGGAVREGLGGQTSGGISAGASASPLGITGEERTLLGL